MKGPIDGITAVRVVLFECAGKGLKGWTECLDTIAATRDQNPERYDQFTHALNVTVPQSILVAWPDVLKADLTHAEKCLIMCAVGCFMTQWICTAHDDSGWEESWSKLTEFLVTLSDAMAGQCLIEWSPKIDESWHSLVAAAS